jgi:hypothetical protein
MALLGVNAATGRRGTCPRATRRSARRWRLPPGAPVTIMIHGYRFCPFSPPMTRTAISCRSPPASDCWKAVSWPRHLHLDRPGRARHRLRLARDGRPAPRRRARLRCRAQPGADDRGDPPRAARCARPHRRPFARRPRGADGAGDGAAGRHQPHDPDVGGGVSRRGGARAVPAGGGAVPRAQRDQRRKRGLRPHVPPGRAAPKRALDRPLSAGLGHMPAAPISPSTTTPRRAALGALGHRLRPPSTRICHWSGYMRPGLFAVYRRMLDLREPSFPGRSPRALDPSPHAWGASQRFSPHQTGPRDCILGRAFTGVGMTDRRESVPGTTAVWFLTRTRLS